MKIIYLKNFRKGYATNSSSTHSLIYKNKEDMFKDLNIFELNYYDRCDSTIAVTKEAKIKYIAANIFYNKALFKIMSAFYPEMKQYIPIIKKQLKEYNKPYPKISHDIFGMAARGPLYFTHNQNIEASIDYLRYVIDNDEIVIVGGSDEMDFVYDTIENHKKVTEPDDCNDKFDVVKNGNYWVGMKAWGRKGDRIRFTQKNEECIPQYPELIDLKITNKCNHNCPFCYMGSNNKGKHADLHFLKNIINNISNTHWNRYKTRVEFAIGGGNVLLYPQLEELFKYIKEEGNIINTTINVKDLEKITTDEKYKNIFEKYVSGVGISINNTEDIDIIKKYKPSKVFSNILFVLHIIPEMIGIKDTIKIINEAYKNNIYYTLFLGYKTNNRGASQKHIEFTDKDLDKLFNGRSIIGVDTTFANKYYDWIKDNYEEKLTLTRHEGEFSMYVDGVEKKAYKSSYQLDKPYNLDQEPYTYTEKDDKWFSLIDAFGHIREDDGFKKYEETFDIE